MERIGAYRLLTRPGGGAGAVRRAAGPDGRDVAIRLLPPDAAPDIARMRQVLSPYVVDVLDGEPAGPQPYVVARFVPGRPLAETVAEQGPVAGAELRRLAFGLAKALDAIHATGLAHGRLGPETILVVDGAPVVVDFGLDADAAAAGDVRAWAAAVTFAATGTSAEGTQTRDCPPTCARWSPRPPPPIRPRGPRRPRWWRRCPGWTCPPSRPPGRPPSRSPRGPLPPPARTRASGNLQRPSGHAARPSPAAGHGCSRRWPW